MHKSNESRLTCEIWTHKHLHKNIYRYVSQLHIQVILSILPGTVFDALRYFLKRQTPDADDIATVGDEYAAAWICSRQAGVVSLVERWVRQWMSRRRRRQRWDRERRRRRWHVITTCTSSRSSTSSSWHRRGREVGLDLPSTALTET